MYLSVQKLQSYLLNTLRFVVKDYLNAFLYFLVSADSHCLSVVPKFSKLYITRKKTDIKGHENDKYFFENKKLLSLVSSSDWTFTIIHILCAPAHPFSIKTCTFANKDLEISSSFIMFA